MNWLSLAVLGLIAYHAVDGFRRGFIRKSVSVLSLVVTLTLVTWLTPKITELISEKTPIEENLQKKCSELFLNEEYDADIKTDQVQMIEQMELPENLKEMILENNNNEAYDLLEVTGFYEYVGAYLASLIVHALAYLITFIIVWTAIRAVLLALDVVAMLPVLRGVNKLAGAVLGAAEGVVFVWIAFLLVTIFCNGDVGQLFFSLISESEFLMKLYNGNLIMKIVFGLIF